MNENVKTLCARVRTHIVAVTGKVKMRTWEKRKRAHCRFSREKQKRGHCCFHVKHGNAHIVSRGKRILVKGNAHISAYIFIRENINIFRENYEEVMNEPLDDRQLPYVPPNENIDVGQGDGNY